MKKLNKTCLIFLYFGTIIGIYSVPIPKGLYWNLSSKMYKNPTKHMLLEKIQADIPYIFIFDGISFKTFRKVTGIPGKGETIPDFYDEIKLCGKYKWCQFYVGKKVTYSIDGKNNSKLYNIFTKFNGYLLKKRYFDNGKYRSQSYFVRITDKKIIKAYLRHVELTHKYSLKDLGFDDKNENKLYQVTAGSGLIARVKPSTKSKHVDWVPANGRVYVTGKTKVKQTIEGKTAYWVKVKLMNGKIGYMFSGFLEKTP